MKNCEKTCIFTRSQTKEKNTGLTDFVLRELRKVWFSFPIYPRISYPLSESESIKNKSQLLGAHVIEIIVSFQREGILSVDRKTIQSFHEFSIPSWVVRPCFCSQKHEESTNFMTEPTLSQKICLKTKTYSLTHRHMTKISVHFITKCTVRNGKNISYLAKEKFPRCHGELLLK